MPRSYANNSYNRSVGRVGMPVGSCVISRSSGGGSSVSASGGSSSFRSGCSGGSTRTYVDNSYNRSLGRVGMEHGSMVVSRTGSSGASSMSSSSSSPKTYVDNSYNRSLGRVGMEHGSMVVSRTGSSGASSMSSSISPKTYVDNTHNRKLGRVGMEYGTMVESGSSMMTSAPKVYKDNPMNRRLGRVGKPLGSMVNSSKDSGVYSPCRNEYVDNAINRRLGRVGKPRGSMPVSGKSRQTEMLVELLEHISGAPDAYEGMDFTEKYQDFTEEEQLAVVNNLNNIQNRNNEIRKWMEENALHEKPKTSRNLLSDYKGTKIDFAELTLMEKIGQGGFGDVHLAKWSGSIVAVKKLRVQRVSKKRLQEFTDEVLLFCQLDHPCIVKFLGACITTPNICIVMEYMQMSLFEALHIDENIDFTETERLGIIRQASSAIEFLHSSNIAHCDIKSQNVLLDFTTGETPAAKITDFGLSMVKHESESSSSRGHEYVRNIGTPRYSAPEVLRGEMLNLSALKKADIYSLALVIFEVISEEEPFYKLNYAQLQQQVGHNELLPSVPVNILLEPTVLDLLMDCWSSDVNKRPNAERVCLLLNRANALYATV